MPDQKSDLNPPEKQHEEIVLDSDDDDSSDARSIDLASSDESEDDDVVIVKEHDTSRRKCPQSSPRKPISDPTPSTSQDSAQEKLTSSTHSSPTKSGQVDDDDDDDSAEDSDFDAESEDDSDEDDDYSLFYKEPYEDPSGMLCFDLRESDPNTSNETELTEANEERSASTSQAESELEASGSESVKEMDVSEESEQETTLATPSESSDPVVETVAYLVDQVAGPAESSATSLSNDQRPVNELDTDEDDESEEESDTDDEEEGGSEQEADDDDAELEEDPADTVPDPFLDFEVGAACSEIEDKVFLEAFNLAEQFQAEFNSEPQNPALRQKYLDQLHECVILPSFKRMTKDPRRFDWPKSRRRVYKIDPRDRLVMAFIKIQRDLSQIVHNPIPHLMQLAMISPNNKQLWSHLARTAIFHHDRKIAEFALRRCIFLGDGRKGHERLCIMFYAVGDFAECLNAIADLHRLHPLSQVGDVLIDLMLNTNSTQVMWIKKLMYEKAMILENVQEVREQIKSKCADCEKLWTFQQQLDNFTLTITTQDLDFLVFAEKLRTTYEKINNKLATRITLVFEPPDNQLQSAPAEPDMIQLDSEESDPEEMEVEECASPSRSVQEEEQSMEESELSEEELDVDVDEAVRETVNFMLAQLENNEGLSEGQSAATPTSQRRKKKKQYDSVPRRSTRFVEEIEDTPFTCMPVAVEDYDLRKCLDLQKDQTLQLPRTSVNEYYLNLTRPNSPPQRVLSSRPNLDVTEFVMNLMDHIYIDGHYNVTFITLIDAFLSHFTVKFLKERLKLTEDQCKTYLDLYELWLDLRRLGGSEKRSRKPFQIHALAAELGHEGAIRNLDAHFAHYIQGLNEFQLPPTDHNWPMTNEPINLTNDLMKHLIVDNHYMHEHKSQLSSELVTQQRWQRREESKETPREMEQSVVPDCFVQTFLALNGHKDTDLDMFFLHFDQFVSVEPAEKFDEQDFEVDDDRVVLRYHWTRALQLRVQNTKFAMTNEQHHLTQILKLVDRMSPEDRDNINKTTFTSVTHSQAKFSLEYVVVRLVDIQKVRLENKIKCLIANKDVRTKDVVEKTVELVLHYVDWSRFDLHEKLLLHKLAFSLYKKHKMFDMIFELIMSVMDGILNSQCINSSESIESVEFLLSELDSHLDELPPDSTAQLKLMLFELTEKFVFRKSIKLWKLMHKLVRKRDPQDVAGHLQFYAQTENVKDRLITPSLMFLRVAHKILGDDRRCVHNNGEFLDFQLQQICDTIASPVVAEFLDNAAVNRLELVTNLEREIFQTLSCLTSTQVRSRQRYKEHGASLRQLPPTQVLLQCLELVLPKKLPMFDDNDILRAEYMDLIRLAQPTLEEPITDQLRQQFADFLQQNVDFTPTFHMDPNNQLLPCDPHFEGRNLREWPMVEDEDRWRALIRAKCLYLLAIQTYRNSAKNVAEMANNVLIVGRELGPDLLASVWMMLAKTSVVIMNYTDEDLRESAKKILFPFRMSMLLKNDLAEAHLDLGVILYQLRARMYRASRVKSSLLKLDKTTENRWLNLAKTHLLLADRFKTQAIDIGWLCCYFLGKVSEKIGNNIDETVDYYVECCHGLDADKYMFLTKVSAKNQINLEPLEIFYRVHSFLGKVYQKSKALESEQSAKIARKVCDYLKYFSLYGLSRKPADNLHNVKFLDSHPAALASVSSILDNIVDQRTEDPVQNVVNEQVPTLLRHAYESILSRFPHYKAAYRLAELEVNAGNYEQAVKVLVESAFRCSRKVNTFVDLFAHMVEIKRSDFERSQSANYHAARCLQVYMKCLEQTDGLGQMLVVLHTLLNPNYNGCVQLTPETLTIQCHACVEHLKVLLGRAGKQWLSSWDQMDNMMSNILSCAMQACSPADKDKIQDLVVVWRKASSRISALRAARAPQQQSAAHRPLQQPRPQPTLADLFNTHMHPGLAKVFRSCDPKLYPKILEAFGKSRRNVYNNPKTTVSPSVQSNATPAGIPGQSQASSSTTNPTHTQNAAPASSNAIPFSRPSTTSITSAITKAQQLLTAKQLESLQRAQPQRLMDKPSTSSVNPQPQNKADDDVEVVATKKARMDGQKTPEVVVLNEVQRPNGTAAKPNPPAKPARPTTAYQQMRALFDTETMMNALKNASKADLLKLTAAMKPAELEAFVQLMAQKGQIELLRRIAPSPQKKAPTPVATPPTATQPTPSASSSTETQPTPTTAGGFPPTSTPFNAQSLPNVPSRSAAAQTGAFFSAMMKQVTSMNQSPATNPTTPTPSTSASAKPKSASKPVVRFPLKPEVAQRMAEVLAQYQKTSPNMPSMAAMASHLQSLSSQPTSSKSQAGNPPAPTTTTPNPTPGQPAAARMSSMVGRPPTVPRQKSTENPRKRQMQPAETTPAKKIKRDELISRIRKMSAPQRESLRKMATEPGSQITAKDREDLIWTLNELDRETRGGSSAEAEKPKSSSAPETSATQTTATTSTAPNPANPDITSPPARSTQPTTPTNSAQLAQAQQMLIQSMMAGQTAANTWSQGLAKSVVSAASSTKTPANPTNNEQMMQLMKLYGMMNNSAVFGRPNKNMGKVMAALMEVAKGEKDKGKEEKRKEAERVAEEKKKQAERQMAERRKQLERELEEKRRLEAERKAQLEREKAERIRLAEEAKQRAEAAKKRAEEARRKAEEEKRAEAERRRDEKRQQQEAEKERRRRAAEAERARRMEEERRRQAERRRQLQFEEQLRAEALRIRECEERRVREAEQRHQLEAERRRMAEEERRAVAEMEQSLLADDRLSNATEEEEEAEPVPDLFRRRSSASSAHSAEPPLFQKPEAQTRARHSASSAGSASLHASPLLAHQAVFSPRQASPGGPQPSPAFSVPRSSPHSHQASPAQRSPAHAVLQPSPSAQPSPAGRQPLPAPSPHFSQPARPPPAYRPPATPAYGVEQAHNARGGVPAQYGTPASTNARIVRFVGDANPAQTAVNVAQHNPQQVYGRANQMPSNVVHARQEARPAQYGTHPVVVPHSTSAVSNQVMMQSTGYQGMADNARQSKADQSNTDADFLSSFLAEQQERDAREKSMRSNESQASNIRRIKEEVVSTSQTQRQPVEQTYSARPSNPTNVQQAQYGQTQPMAYRAQQQHQLQQPVIVNAAQQSQVQGGQTVRQQQQVHFGLNQAGFYQQQHQEQRQQQHQSQQQRQQQLQEQQQRQQQQQIQLQQQRQQQQQLQQQQHQLQQQQQIQQQQRQQQPPVNQPVYVRRVPPQQMVVQQPGLQVLIPSAGSQQPGQMAPDVVTNPNLGYRTVRASQPMIQRTTQPTTSFGNGAVVYSSSGGTQFYTGKPTCGAAVNAQMYKDAHQPSTNAYVVQQHSSMGQHFQANPPNGQTGFAMRNDALSPSYAPNQMPSYAGHMNGANFGCNQQGQFNNGYVMNAANNPNQQQQINPNSRSFDGNFYQ